MSRTSNATSGFDVELNISGNYITHLLQLLIDAGELPRSFNVGGASADLESSTVVSRDYVAVPGAEYAHTSSTALQAKFAEFSSRPKFIYINLTFPLVFASGGESILILTFRVKNEIDVVDLFTDIQIYVNTKREHPGGPFSVAKPRLSRYIKCMAALPASDPAYDPATTADGSESGIPEMVNDQLHSAFDAMLDEMVGLEDDKWEESAINKLLDPLTPASVSRLHLKVLSADVLGIYPVFKLLDKDGGIVESDGDVGSAQVLLEPGEDIAVCTKDDFCKRLAEDVILKMILGLRLKAGNFTEEDVPDKMNDISFPVTIGTTLLEGIMEGTLSLTDEEPTGESDIPQWLIDTVTFLVDNDIADVEVKGVDVKLEPNHKYFHQDGHDEVTEHTADSIKVSIELGADLVEIFPLLSQNLNLYLTPVEHTYNGQTCRDLGVSVNTSANAWVSLLLLLYPAGLAAPAALGMPILGVASVTAASSLLCLLAVIVPAQYILTAVANGAIRKGEDDKDKNTIGNLGENGVEVFFNQVIQESRWDPFYTTEHAMVIPSNVMIVEDTQLFFAGGIILSNQTTNPYETVYMRDITRTSDAPQQYDELYYRVGQTDLIDTGTQFATNRWPSRAVTTDSETRIYALKYSDGTGQDALNRLVQDRLQGFIQYAPYAVQHNHDEDSDWIEKIQILSTIELNSLIDRVKDNHFNEYIESVVELFNQYYYDLNGEFPPDALKETVRAAATDSYAASSDWADYQESGYLSDLQDALLAPGVLRLLPWQEELQDLVIDHPFISFPGYEYIRPRDDRPYWRNKADDTTANNLEALPEVE